MPPEHLWYILLDNCLLVELRHACLLVLLLFMVFEMLNVLWVR